MNSLKKNLLHVAEFIWGNRALWLLGSGVVTGAVFLLGHYVYGNTLLAIVIAIGAVLAPSMAMLLATALLLKLRGNFRALNAAVYDSKRRLILQEQDIRDLRTLVEVRTNALHVQTNKLAVEFADMRQNASKIMRQFKKVDEKLSAKASAEKFAQAGAELADLKVALRDLKVVLRDMEFKSAGYRVHSRSLSRDDLKTLLVDWSEPLGLRHTSHTIGYLANKITALEEQCVGRLATTSQTMIARILAAQSLSLSSQTLRILEIGVLFGVASICFRKLCAPYFRDISLTLLDPFEGYYEQDVADLITGVPVSREALEENILNPTAQHADYEVISGFSHDPAIVSQLEGREFDLLLIDGDHSYEGVKKDYELYAPMVREGGIILFDDYDVAEWPDIKRFVDEGPAKSDHLEFVKYGFRTAAFRVKSRDRGA